METKRVLFLDNDESVLDIMHEALNYEGFDIKCLGRSNDIFAEIDDYQPDIIIIDYLLDGINGGELCHQVKQNERTKDIPVILVSAYPRVLQSLGAYGCDDFIPKPFDLYDFVARIKNLTDNKESQGLYVV